MKKRGNKPEEVFLDNLQRLVKNLLVDNINYKHYPKTGQGCLELQRDTKERGKYILSEIEKTKHLLKE
jgi:hypothetical protein